MASSGSYNFSMTRTDIIESALRKCGLLVEGQSASANQLTDGAEALNVILKALESTGRPLFSLRRVYVLPIDSVNSVILSSSGGYATTTVVHTQLSVAAVASDGTVTVDDDTGMTDGDYIGIATDDGTIHWTTINGTPASNVITLTTAIDSAAAIDSDVYTFTNKLPTSPLRITDAWLRQFSAGDGNLGGKTYPINVLSRVEYYNISDRTVEGSPYNVYYHPDEVSGAFQGTLYFANRYLKCDKWIEVDAIYPFEDMDNATDNLGLPAEWLDTIILKLAVRLGMEGRIPSAVLGIIKSEYKEARDEVEDMGMEEGSVRFVPNLDGRAR